MGCSADKIETKTVGIPQKNIQQLTSNTNIQIITPENNVNNSKKIQNQYLNNIENNKPLNNNPQNLQNNISNNNASNNINSIENKKDNNLSPLNNYPNIKLKAFNYYTNEESAQIYDIINKNESQFKTDVNIFYKSFVELEKEITTFKEYITLFTKKEKGKKYSSIYEFKSPIIEGRKVIESFVKLNGKKFETYEVQKNNYEYKIKFSYDLNENDDSIITLEVLTIAKTIVALDKTAIKLMFFPKFQGCLFSIVIESINDFVYHNINYKPTGKNNYNIISPTKFEFIGKNCEASNYIIFQCIDSKILFNKNDIAFYCYDEEELKILENSINSMKLYYEKENIFSEKNFYNIIGETCIVKSYITFLYLDNINEIWNSYVIFLPEKYGLKFINLKINNENISKKNIAKYVSKV